MVLRLPDSWSNWNLEMLVFEERGKPEYPEKNLSDMIASAKAIDVFIITLFNSCINFTNVHLCNYCTKIFVIVVNTCVCRRSVDNKALILSYPILSRSKGENHQQTQPTYGEWRRRRDLNPGHIGGRRVLSPLLPLCLFTSTEPMFSAKLFCFLVK